MTFRSPSRAAGVAAARARQDWLLLLQRAEAVGGLAAEGAELPKGEAVAFAGLLVRNGDTDTFPAPFASARNAAGGFRELARGFVTAAQPELKAALGRAMAEAARCCRRMIEIETERLAETWRRASGEGED